MLNFDDIEDLISYIFEKLDDDESVSVVANKDLSLSIIKELLEYENIILKYANVDDYEYNREYIVTLHDDIDTDDWDIAIEPIYNYEKEMYFGTDGYVLFHEDVNSKVMIDMQNNKNVEISGHDWFVINDESDDNDTDEHEMDNGKVSETKPSTTSSATYKINGKEVSKDRYESELEKIEGIYLDNMRDILLGYAEVMDEVNEWRKLLCW